MSNDALIDSLIAQYNNPETPKKPKGPKKRKGLSAVKAKEKQPSGDVPSLVEEGTRAYNIAQAIVQGKELPEIALEYGLTEQNIKATITKAMEEVFEETAPIFANFAMISMNRMERIVEKLLPKMFDEDGHEDGDVIELYRKIYGDQKELVMMITGAGKKRPPELPEMGSTMSSGSRLYEESMDALRSRKNGNRPMRESDISDLDDLFENNGIISDQGRSQVVRQS